MNSRTKRILYIEGNSDMAALISLLLNQPQYELTIATTTMEAMSLINSQSFQLYILGGTLGDSEGLALCGHIRAVDHRRPILVFSVNASEANERKALAAGAQVYVAKSAIAELEAAIQRLLIKPRANRRRALNEVERLEVH